MRSWRLSNHRPKKENREKLSAGSKDRVEMGGMEFKHWYRGVYQGRYIYIWGNEGVKDMYIRGKI